MKYSTFILFFLLAIPISLLAQTSSYSISNVNTSCGSGTTGTGTPCGLEYFGSNIKLSSSPSMGGSGSTTLSVSINRCTGTTALVGQVYLKMSNSSSISDVVCGTNIAQNLNGNASTLTLSADLGSLFTSGTRYFTMVFINSTGVRSYSRVFSVTATPPSCNIQTSSGFASSITASSFTANWNAVLGATNYQMSYTTNSDINYTNALNYTQTTTSRTLSNLFSSTSYRFRVRAQCSNGLYGPWVEVSNITTAAPPPPTITLTNPPPDSWGFGQTRSLSWSITNNGCGPYNVEVSTNAGSSWILIGRGISGTSMNWTVGKDVNDNPIPNMLNNPNLRVKVYCQNNTSISTQSTTFSLAVPSITVTTPQALTTGQTQNITWTVNNAVCTQFTVELSTNGGSTPWNVLKTFHPQTSLSWTIPNDQNGNAISSAVGSSTNRLKVYCSGYDAISGTSGNFSVSTPSCNLTLPAANTGTVSNIASAGFTATWPAISGATEYRINVATINNTTYSAPLSFTGLTTTNSINVTGLSPSTQYRYQIQAKCANGVWTSWSSTLATPTTNGPLSLTQLTGATWHCTKTIQWTSQPNIGNVTIELGNTNTGIIGVIGTNLPNTGSYDWVVGKRMLNGNTVDFENFDFTQTYYLKIYPTGTANQASTGNGFTIPRPTISVSSPAANSTFNAGQTITMNYVSQNLCGPMTVELTNSSGTTLQVMPNGSNIANASPYTFTVTNTFPQPGTYRLKIYPTVSGGNSPAVGLSEVFTVGGTTVDCPTCISTGITEANFPNTGNEGFCAAQYLCNLGIIQPQQNNAGYTPVDPIKRADLAKLMLYSLFDDGFAATYHQNPSILTFPIDSYVTPFEDLNYSNNTANYDRPAKIMSYLYWSNDSKGLTPFKRNRTNFYPNENITRMDFLQVLLEAWNIPSDATVNAPYSDDFTNVPIETRQYINKAFSLGIITHSVSNPLFRPFDEIKREEAYTILVRLRKLNSVTKPSQASLTNAGNYLFESNITTENVSIMRSMGEGNFAFAEEGFSIPDIGIPLSFGFSYNSFGTQLPDVYRLIEPLGVGWTHNLNSYIQTTTASVNEGNVVVGKALLLLANGDGTWHTYDNSNPNAPVKRSIDNFNTLTVVTNSSTTYYEVKRPDLVTFKYEKQGNEVGLYRLTSIKDRHGNTLSIVYKNGASVPFSGYSQVIDYVQSPSGRRAVFTYNTSNQITEVSFPGKTSSSPRRLRFEYYTGWDGKSNYLRKFTSARHYGTTKGTTYTYGTGLKKYLLESIKRPKGNEIKTEFGTDNKLQKIEEKNGTSTANTTTIARTTGGTCPSGTTCATVTNADGTVTNQKINLVGTIYEITSPTVNLALPEYSANPSNPAFFEVNGKRTKYQYNALGMVLRIDYLMPDKVTTHSYETFTYNTTYNNLESHRDPNGNTTYFDFSADGKYLNGIRKPFANNNQYINQTFTYYANGLLKEAINQELITTKFYYDSYGNNNRIEFPLLNLNSYASHDYAGRIATITNAKGKVSTSEFDDNDNLIKTIAPSPLSYVTQYGFDDNDLLNTITNAKGKITTVGRDNFDRVETISFEGMVQKYFYRTDGKLDKYEKTGFGTNGDRYFKYTYDTEGRLKSNRYLSNVTFNSTTKNLLSVSGGTSSGHLLKDFGFDELNRLNAYTDNFNNTTGYGYDNNGNVTRIDYPNGNKVYYTYDQANRLKTVKWNTITIATYEYVGSRLDYVQYGNGVRTQYNYDNAGRLDGITTKTNNGTGSTIAAYTFEFDNLGNHLTENITEPYSTIPTPPASTTTYTYKPNNQIETAGNITFTHDGDGNVITKGGLTYTYDLEDNLISITGNGLNITFEYDAFGNRRIATRNGTVTRYVLDMMGLADVLAELDANNAPQNYYIHGLGLVARVKGNGSTIHYYHADFRGSVVAMTDANQNITHKYQYDEYGILLNSQEADANPFRYVGTYGIMYETADLSYMRARYYDPTIGRFNSTDPIWHVNLYPYAGNNGVMNVDVTGEVLETAWDAANVGLGVYQTWDDFSNGDYVWGTVSAIGTVIDVGATALPFIPGGAGTAIKAAKVARNVDNIASSVKGTSKQVAKILSTEGTQLIGKQGEYMADQILREMYPNGKIISQIPNGAGKSTFDRGVVLGSNTLIFEVKATLNSVPRGRLSKPQVLGSELVSNLSLLKISITSGVSVLKKIK